MSTDARVVNPLPPQRRIVTGHDANGRSIHAKDHEFTTEIVKTPVRTVGFKVSAETNVAGGTVGE
jgi:hypothetical protein